MSRIILLPLWTVPTHDRNLLTFRTLDIQNPYSHYALDNPQASKICRGRLFEGVVEDEGVDLERGRNNHNNWLDEIWNLDSDEEE